MRAVDIIRKKRDGQALQAEEIGWFISQYTAEDIPDYQAAALLMAIVLKGMTRQETVALTQAMAYSGHMMNLSSITDYAIDKHSSGGVGDKTSLVVLPLVAACGVTVAKMSGRGLGFSGGTLDKLEAIAGYRVQLDDAEFQRLARRNGIVLCGQTAELAPADGKLYALRDVTATVESVPLIASSIMSKKLASGANGIVLDVKWGNGAFMHTLEDARQLARTMVKIGVDAGRDVIALISDMNQPLGYAVGNALEVKEAIATLNGEGPADFRAHCLGVATHMLELAGRGVRWKRQDDVPALLTEKLDNGEALAKFRQMIEAQGGDVSMVDDPSKLPQAMIQVTARADERGYLARLGADNIAQAALALGAGRQTKGQAVDLAVGVEVHVKVGDEIAPGDLIATIHANSEQAAHEAMQQIEKAVQYSTKRVEAPELFNDLIDGRDV